MPARQELIRQLVEIIKNYRKDSLASRPDVLHVERWIAQFPEAERDEVLREMVFTLNKTYFSEEKVKDTFSSLLFDNKPVTDAELEFWKRASLLDIQKGGNSQHELSKLVSTLIKQRSGFIVPTNSPMARNYLYIDDVVFSGNRLLSDLRSWITDVAPEEARLYIVVIGLHLGGEWYVGQKLESIISQSGKKITIAWHWSLKIEDRLRHINASDVLRPVSAPQDAQMTSHILNMAHKPTFRVTGGVGKLGFFSSELGRHTLEQSFLTAGVYILDICKNLGEKNRPLGYSALETLGFGSMIVTYRNCPNNAPLALWVNHPWYPLLPRSTNADAALQRAWAEAL
ncbi:hypothetical protein DFO59_105196 [Pseudomonas fluorescens]|nr:hypothetical protein DFO59_105196 [Pseudomonas fluorescens]